MKTLSSAIFPKECKQFPNTLGLYVAEQRLGYIKYIFDVDFIHLTRYAISTDCVSEFSEEQLKFFMDWLEYQTSLMNDSVSYPEDSPIVAFDRELVNISECIDTTDQIICGNSLLHDYNACIVN